MEHKKNKIASTTSLLQPSGADAGRTLEVKVHGEDNTISEALLAFQVWGLEQM